jgi:phosphoglucomutase
VEVIDPVSDYMELAKEVFDFDLIRLGRCRLKPVTRRVESA